MRYILAAFLLVAFAKGAFACSCRESSPQEVYSKSKAIFVAQITQTYRINRWLIPDVVRGVFDVVEVLKGNPEIIPYVESRVPMGADCSLPLAVGLSYLFVLYQDNSISGCTSVMVEHFPAQQWLSEFRKVRDSSK
jgi:hypothetical protein